VKLELPDSLVSSILLFPIACFRRSPQGRHQSSALSILSHAFSFICSFCWRSVLCCKNNVLLMMGGVGLPSTLWLQTAPERWRLLKAHGPAVGLPSEEDMGNSEVGHNALGAGRIFKQG
jgi:hypothetical protein